MALKTANTGWWGEGEIKFFIDGDNEFPTICRTGTEDYFGGSHNFDVGHRYVPYNTPYLGLCQVEPSDEIYVVDQKFGMYRWHVYDPVRFEKDLKVTIQDLGWMIEQLCHDFFQKALTRTLRHCIYLRANNKSAQLL